MFYTRVRTDVGCYQDKDMKSIKILVLAVIITLITGFEQSGTKYFPDAGDRKTEYLSSFAKLYGYIRYFYPGDEASSLDWNKFLCYGIEQVLKAKDKTSLKKTLDSLFLPIAPNLDIFFKGETPQPYQQSENVDDLVLVTWQHKGVGADPNPVYKSIRLGRINWAFYSRFGIFQQFNNRYDCGNKKFRLSANVSTSDNGKGEIELFGYNNSTGEIFFRSGTINNEEVEPFTLEGEFSEGISYLILTIRLLEKGEMQIDNLSFQLEKDNGKLQPFSISKNQFISDEQDEIDDGWSSNGLGFKYSIEKSIKKNSITLASSDEFEYNSLFDKHCKRDELVNKDLGNGISCRFPLALYLPREKPGQFSESFVNLNNRINQVNTERNGARSNVARLGTVITAWNIFQHFYPYFDVVLPEWENILKQTLSEVTDDQDDFDFMRLLRKMTAALQDGHVKITHTMEGGFKPLPVIFDYAEDQIVVVAANSDQLQRGDILFELDGKPASQLLFDYEKIVSGSPQWRRFKALRDFTRDDSTKSSHLKIKRDEDLLEVTIDRRLALPNKERPDNVSEIKEDIYYVNLCKAAIEEIDNRIQDISKAKGVVFDLRGYPNNNHTVIGYMIDYPVQSAKWLKPEIIYPDHENIAGYDTTGRWRIEPLKPRIQGKIVFITDENAISYAESFMGIIEHYKLAEIIGSTTAGANGNVNSVTTLGGFKIQWTGMKVLKHNDSQHHLVGIKPTFPMEPTLQGIREGRDELLEKAIEIISE